MQFQIIKVFSKLDINVINPYKFNLYAPLLVRLWHYNNKYVILCVCSYFPLFNKHGKVLMKHLEGVLEHFFFIIVIIFIYLFNLFVYFIIIFLNPQFLCSVGGAVTMNHLCHIYLTFPSYIIYIWTYHKMRSGIMPHFLFVQYDWFLYSTLHWSSIIEISPGIFLQAWK